jgi:hypothetical protein
MKRENPWARLLTGLAVLSFGVILWLDHLHRLNASDYLRWWPVLLIASGLANLYDRRWVGATILILLGIAFLPRIPYIPHLRVSQLFALTPLLITVGGITLVLQALRPATRDPRASFFRAIAVMGGSGRVIGSNEIVAGDAIAVMGGCEIDFTPAMGVREATIDVLVFWGGIEIKVPRGWKVENHVAVILGAFAARTSAATAPDAPRLVIRGSVIMGGLEVRNPKEETA